METYNIILIALFTLLMVTETIISAVYNYKWYHGSDSAVSMSMSALNALLDLALKGFTFFILTWFHQFSVYEWKNPVILWTVLILLEDLAYYALHWVDHNVRFFWAVHVTHHNSEKMNFLTAIRSSVFQPLYRWIYYVPLAVFGFDAWQIMTCYTICNWWGNFIHTEAIGKLGLLDKIFATPSNHRVHHGSNPHYLDRNMGMFLIIWDRIFNTYQREDEKVIYGLTTNIEAHRLDKAIFHECAAIWNDAKHAKKLRHKFMYIFGPPGWSHDGSRATSKQLRNAYFDKLDQHKLKGKSETVREVEVESMANY